MDLRQTDILNNCWRDGRVVEGARLESVCASNGTAGSNPVLSAKLSSGLHGWYLIGNTILSIASH